MQSGLPIVGGAVSFSGGVLSYSFGRAVFLYDTFRAPRQLYITDIHSKDPEFLHEPWLVELYPHVLAANKSNDPFVPTDKLTIEFRPGVSYSVPLSVWLTAIDGRCVLLHGYATVYGPDWLIIDLRQVEFDV